MANRPAPELELTDELVRTLVASQCPEFGDLALRELSRGWDNTNFRLGDEYIVRVPHRAMAAQLVVNEHRWLPMIAARVDLAVPAPVHRGTPTDEYPWHWSIVPWIEGSEAATTPLVQGRRAAEVLGRFFTQLHTAAPPDSPPNPYRGCPLTDRAKSFETNLIKLGAEHDKVAIAEVFETAAALAPSSEHVWLHGDLHPRNLIVNDDQLVAAIDWGDICAGDRATDLAAAYMLVPDEVATVANHASADPVAWQRARGWAINFAVVYLAHSDNDPVMGAIGQRLLAALLG